MKKILILLAAAVFTMTACTWNDYENLDFTHKTQEELDPAGYEAYLAAVKEFKSTEHPVVILGMDASIEPMTSQPMHPMVMPDSADFLMIKHPEAVHPDQSAELEEVYAKKGTKSLAYIDLKAVREMWSIFEENAESKLTLQDTLDFFKKETQKLVDACADYPYHGFVFSAEGAADECQQAFVSVAKKCIDENAEDMTIIFRGTIRNINDEDMLMKCKYVMIPCGESESVSAINDLVSLIIDQSETADRVLIDVTVPSSENPSQVGATPEIAADWVLESNVPEFTPQGFSVNNADDDYYCYSMIFEHVRKGITRLHSTIE